MTTIMRYDPFREALSLHNAMDQLFAQSFVSPNWGSSAFAGQAITMDVFETEQGYQVKVLLPGVKPEDLDLSAQQNTLTIKGQFQSSVKPDQQVNWLVQEISEGSFERSITFPKPMDTDKITTSYEHGVLTISVPVSEASRPKKISITDGQPKQMAVEAGKQ
ncbi:MAG: Hsp20/alpha crystallin family protein [Ktedonobacteraceae bacterium]